MNKSQLIEKVSEKLTLPRTTVDLVVKTLFDQMEDSLCYGSDVTITGFGTFYLVWNEPREILVPSTGKLTNVPGKMRLRFKGSDKLKKRIASNFRKDQAVTPSDLDLEMDEQIQKTDKFKNKIALDVKKEQITTSPDLDLEKAS